MRGDRKIRFMDDDPADVPVHDPGLKQSPAAKRAYFWWKFKGVARFGTLILVRLGLLRPDLALLLPLILDLVLKDDLPKNRSQTSFSMASRLLPLFKNRTLSSLEKECADYIRDKNFSQ